MSHPVGAGAGRPAGAHPLNNEHRRRGGWWWLLALLALLLVALLIVLLVRHFSDNNATTAAKQSPPSASAPTPASTATTSSAPATAVPVSPASSAAAAPAVADAACIKPVLTVSPQSVRAGQTVTVIGRHFSGCHAENGAATPSLNLPVSVGVADVSSVSHALAKARTSASGYFKVSFVVPASAVTGNKSITLAAASRDAITTLAYAGATTVASSASATSPAGGGRPTGVPAGTGGLAASTSSTDVEAQWGLLAGGLLLAAGGATVLARRRRSAR